MQSIFIQKINMKMKFEMLYYNFFMHKLNN